jgi:hypothetical protein
VRATREPIPSHLGESSSRPFVCSGGNLSDGDEEERGRDLMHGDGHDRRGGSDQVSRVVPAGDRSQASVIVYKRPCWVSLCRFKKRLLSIGVKDEAGMSTAAPITTELVEEPARCRHEQDRDEDGGSESSSRRP